MRCENVLSPYVIIAAAMLGLAACSDSSTTTPEGDPPEPLSDEKTSLAIRMESDGTGNCNYDANLQDRNVAALNAVEYGRSAKCGACAEVTGPGDKKIVVRIVDSCAGCSEGQLALSKEAFSNMGASDYLQTDIRWRYVTCPVTGPIRYRFKEDSNPYWVAIQVRNHRLPVEKLEWQKNGAWVEVPRQEYNYFVEPSGMGPGPLRVRVTSMKGQQLEDTLPQVIQATVVEGAAQFDVD